MRSLYKTTLAVLLCICLPLTLIALPLSGSLHAAPAKKILSTQSKSKAGAPVRPATKAAKQPLAPQAVKSAGTGNKRVGAGNKTAQTPSVRSQSKTAPQPVRTAAVQKNKDSAKEEAARKAASAKARQETARTAARTQAREEQRVRARTVPRQTAAVTQRQREELRARARAVPTQAATATQRQREELRARARAVPTQRQAEAVRSTRMPTVPNRSVVQRDLESDAPIRNRILQHQSSRAQRTAFQEAPEIIPYDSSEFSLDEALQLTSKSYMVMDADTGREIVSKNPDVPRQPASTIKIVTGLISLLSLDNADQIAVSRHAASMPASKVYIKPGKIYSANDMINSVLLASANDASVALGEHIAGSEDSFARMMTSYARRWGATNTVCRTASGLTADGQQSTARDLATLFRYAMQNREFARRMHRQTVGTSFTKKPLKNHNKALWRLDGAIAGKTGFTKAAGQTYVGQFTRYGQTIIVALMGSGTMWADLEKLVDYGFEQKNTSMTGLRF